MSALELSTGAVNLICLPTLLFSVPLPVAYVPHMQVILVLFPSPACSFYQPLRSPSPRTWAPRWTTFTTLSFFPFLSFHTNGSQCPLPNYVQVQISQPPCPSCSPHPGRILTHSAFKSDRLRTQHRPGHQEHRRMVSCLKPQYSRGANTEKFSLASSVWREPPGS